MYRVLTTIGLTFAVVGLMASVQTVEAALLPLDSSAFTYQYEMGADPAGEDLDGVVGNDWQRAGTLPALAGGVMTLTGPSEGNYTSNDGVAGQVWNNMTVANGYTIEARLKTSNATSGLSIISGAGAGCGLVQISSNGMFWTYLNPGGTGSGAQIGPTTDNATDFHNYRIAQLPTTGVPLYNVWRDDVLMGENLPNVFGQTWDYVQFAGQPSGYESNTGQIEYIRIQSGAYAPVPEPTALVMLVTGVIGLLAYAWRKRN